MSTDRLTTLSLPILMVFGHLVGIALSAQTTSTGGLTLDAALARARADSPELRASAAAVEEARGRVVGARTYPHNLVVELEGAERRGPEDAITDRGVALSQEIEIAGQKSRRLAAARADLASAEARHARRRTEVLAAVERSFAAVVRDRELRDVALVDVDLTRNLLRFEERRLAAGAGTQIEVNLARAAAGRAIRRLQTESASWQASRSRLAELVGLDPAAPPSAAAGLAEAPVTVPSLDELIRYSLADRSDLRALRRERERGEREVQLARARAVPNLELGAFASREEGDDILGLRLGIALPLFDRNQGGIARAEATADRLAAELIAAELRARREVAAAYSRYRAASEVVTALEGLVVETLEESLELLRRAVEAGELSATDVLLLRRDLVEGRREQIEAAGELWLARTDLELAVGVDLSAGDPADPEEASDAN
jgi:cobalt-zinc-cadmium efflux system outer membrane protein